MGCIGVVARDSSACHHKWIMNAVCAKKISSATSDMTSDSKIERSNAMAIPIASQEAPSPEINPFRCFTRS